MDKVTIISADSGDARVIQDLFRVYYPGITLAQTQESTAESRENSQVSFLINNNDSNAPDNDGMIKEVVLKIEKKDFPEEISVTMLVAGRVYSRVERTQEETFLEEKNHRARRLLRLALHKLMVEALPITPSAWGFLPG